MDLKDIKIVMDSSADIFDFRGIPFESVPMKIITADKEYADTKELNLKDTVDYLYGYKGKSGTSCPNTEEWLKAFGNAEYVFCITITSKLSGSFNSASQAKRIYEEEYPGRKVFVLDSLSTGAEMVLLAEKIRESVLAGHDFDTVCKLTENYSKRTGLLFVLESMHNLANNGRVSPITAKMAGILGIRVVGKASVDGKLEILNKCRGEKRASETVVWHLREMGLRLGKVKITHCFNEESANRLKKAIESEFKNVTVEIYQCAALCSFYAEKGGMIIGFEKK